MHVVGRGDVYRVYMLALAVQQLAPVLVNQRAWQELPELNGALQVHLGHGHEVQSLGPGKLPDVLQGHAGSPKTGVLEDAAGWPGHQVVRDEWRAQGRSPEGLEKGPAAEGTTGRLSS